MKILESSIEPFGYTGMPFVTRHASTLDAAITIDSGLSTWWWNLQHMDMTMSPVWIKKRIYALAKNRGATVCHITTKEDSLLVWFKVVGNNKWYIKSLVHK
jgi:hypothetical protein